MNKIILLLIILSIYFSCRENENVYIVSAKSGLVLREKPDQLSKRIITLPFKSKVTLLKLSDSEETINSQISKWYNINFNGQIGWVFGAYLIKANNYELVNCLNYSGIYKTVSESEWNYELKLNTDCSYVLHYDSHYWNDGEKVVNINKEDSGLWNFKENTIILKNQKGLVEAFKYSNSLSYEEFGGNGESPSLSWIKEDNTAINFWRFPKDN
ncbi:MAG: SH3 domain-containing protein [Leptospira sp.]|nr:SH3 domain-containing protein [Leptospira sp.]